MPAYSVVVVGTDGSETSLRAVEKAARVAAESGATLVIASAHTAPQRGSGPDPDQPKGEGYRTTGSAPVYDLLRDAAARARAAGATEVKERAIEGAPAEALVALAEEVGADLLVVGSVGLNSVMGKLVGSVPKLVRKRAKVEVMVVDTD